MGPTFVVLFRVFGGGSFQGSTFSVFEVLGTPQMEQKDLKINKKSSQVAPGVPLGGKNVIVAKLQYLPCEINDFRGSEGPEICDYRTDSLKNTSENASLRRSLFRSRFLRVLDQFWLRNAPPRAPQSTPQTPQELPGPPQKPPEKLPRAPGVDLGASGVDLGGSGVDFGASGVDFGVSGP